MPLDLHDVLPMALQCGSCSHHRNIAALPSPPPAHISSLPLCASSEPLSPSAHADSPPTHAYKPQPHAHPDSPPTHAYSPQVHAHTPHAHPDTPPAHANTPKAHADTPPTHVDTPPTQAYTPPAHACWLEVRNASMQCGRSLGREWAFLVMHASKQAPPTIDLQLLCLCMLAKPAFGSGSGALLSQLQQGIRCARYASLICSTSSLRRNQTLWGDTGLSGTGLAYERLSGTGWAHRCSATRQEHQSLHNWLSHQANSQPRQGILLFITPLHRRAHLIPTLSTHTYSPFDLILFQSVYFFSEILLANP